MTTTQKTSLLNALTNLVSEVQTAKLAADSPTPKDPGGYEGPSEHVTTDVSNNGTDVKEGDRAEEYTKDIKRDQGAPAVDNATPIPPGSQDSVQLNVGTRQSAVGEDPATEDDYKAGKDDPGTSHPANTENDSLDGEKYANASASQLVTLHNQLSTEILDAFGVPVQKTAQTSSDDETEKLAAAIVQEGVADIIESASTDASMVANFIGGFIKNAADAVGPESIPPEVAQAIAEEEAAQGAEDEPTEDEAVEELSAALDELGVTPEELVEAEAAANPEAAAAMEEAIQAKEAGYSCPPEFLPESVKLAYVAAQCRASGCRPKFAAAGTKRRVLRDQFKRYILELVSR